MIRIISILLDAILISSVHAQANIKSFSLGNFDNNGRTFVVCCG